MGSKKVQIAPIQQIVSLPIQADINITGDSDFQYAVVSLADLDENKFTLKQSNAGRAAFNSGTSNVLLLKSNGGTCNATIEAKQQPLPQAPQPSPPLPSPKKNNDNRALSMALWLGVAIFVIVILMRRQRQ